MRDALACCSVPALLLNAAGAAPITPRVCAALVVDFPALMGVVDARGAEAAAAAAAASAAAATAAARSASNDGGRSGSSSSNINSSNSSSGGDNRAFAVSKGLPLAQPASVAEGLTHRLAAGFYGDDFEAWSSGALLIAAGANAAPDIFLALQHALRRGDDKMAREIRGQLVAWHAAVAYAITGDSSRSGGRNGGSGSVNDGYQSGADTGKSGMGSGIPALKASTSARVPGYSIAVRPPLAPLPEVARKRLMQWFFTGGFARARGQGAAAAVAGKIGETIGGGVTAATDVWSRVEAAALAALRRQVSCRSVVLTADERNTYGGTSSIASHV